MAVVNGMSEGGKLAKEICDSFGLKHVRSLTMHMPHVGLFDVTAEFYPEIDGIRQIVPILKKFELAERNPVKPLPPPSRYTRDSDMPKEVSIEVPISSVTKNIVMTVEVTGFRAWQIRRTVAICFFRFASWLIGGKINIEVNLEKK
jgi:hypothetical protein